MVFCRVVDATIQEFITREDLELFERRLSEARNPKERAQLTVLIKRERMRLRQLTGVALSD